jgi:hypothetical protein
LLLKALVSLIFVTGTIGGLLLGPLSASAQGQSVKTAEKPPEIKASESKGVIELFTSQGCSSCPAADALFVKLAKRSDLIVLTMPVDYWDYLGWKDTLATPGNTARQKAYAKSRGDGQVYTPQAVVNGQVHVNGSSESQIENALRKTAGKADGARMTVRSWAEKDVVVVELGGDTGGTAASNGTAQAARGAVLLAFVKRQAEVSIGRGENQGRKVVYANVVQHLKPVGEWSGAVSTLRIPRAQLPRDGYDFCAVMIQQGTAGPILAATEIKMN